MIRFIAILFSLLLFMTSELSFAQSTEPVPAGQPEVKNCDTLVLRINERKEALNNEVKIGYVRYSHETSSTSPNEPFSATVGVYFLEAIAKDYLEELVIHKGVNEKDVTVDWRHYKVTLISVSDNQDEIVLSIKDPSKKP